MGEAQNTNTIITGKRARLGDVELNVVFSETPTYPIEVTEYPVEKGSDVGDHAKSKNIQLVITGVCSGQPEAGRKVQKLREYAQKHTLISYKGRNVYHNVIITNLETVHDVEVGDGFKFTITLQQVKIATAKKVPFTAKDPISKKPIAPQVNKVQNKGKIQPQKTIKNLREEASKDKKKTVNDAPG